MRALTRSSCRLLFAAASLPSSSLHLASSCASPARRRLLHASLVRLSAAETSQQTVSASAVKSAPSIDTKGDYTLPHPIWTDEYAAKVAITHRPPQSVKDSLAYYAIQFIRRSFDILTGYERVKLTPDRFLRRMIFLETVAAIPGVSAGMIRTLKSLRTMRRDYGWIHTLNEEAENERMHLLTALHLKNPGLLFRLPVYLVQGGFLLFYTTAYGISPSFAHRAVGYLEEEAVKTYTKCLEHIDKHEFWHDTPAPPIAITYWKLQPTATMRDLILHIRADEAHHREVNHTLASLHPDQPNPYLPGH